MMQLIGLVIRKSGVVLISRIQSYAVVRSLGSGMSGLRDEMVELWIALARIAFAWSAVAAEWVGEGTLLSESPTGLACAIFRWMPVRAKTLPFGRRLTGTVYAVLPINTLVSVFGIIIFYCLLRITVLVGHAMCIATASRLRGRLADK